MEGFECSFELLNTFLEKRNEHLMSFIDGHRNGIILNIKSIEDYKKENHNNILNNKKHVIDYSSLISGVHGCEFKIIEAEFFIKRNNHVIGIINNESIPSKIKRHLIEGIILSDIVHIHKSWYDQYIDFDTRGCYHRAFESGRIEKDRFDKFMDSSHISDIRLVLKEIDCNINFDLFPL